MGFDLGPLTDALGPHRGCLGAHWRRGVGKFPRLFLSIYNGSKGSLVPAQHAPFPALEWAQPSWCVWPPHLLLIAVHAVWGFLPWTSAPHLWVSDCSPLSPQQLKLITSFTIPGQRVSFWKEKRKKILIPVNHLSHHTQSFSVGCKTHWSSGMHFKYGVSSSGFY